MWKCYALVRIFAIIGTIRDMLICCIKMLINYMDCAHMYTFISQYFTEAKISDGHYDMHTIIWVTCL
jgi:proline dehydrogenase